MWWEVCWLDKIVWFVTRVEGGACWTARRHQVRSWHQIKWGFLNLKGELGRTYRYDSKLFFIINHKLRSYREKASIHPLNNSTSWMSEKPEEPIFTLNAAKVVSRKKKHINARAFPCCCCCCYWNPLAQMSSNTPSGFLKVWKVGTGSAVGGSIPSSCWLHIKVFVSKNTET